MDDLETSIKETFVELEISEDNRNAIEAFLAPLKEKSPITRFHYEHSYPGRTARKENRALHAFG